MHVEILSCLKIVRPPLLKITSVAGVFNSGLSLGGSMKTQLLCGGFFLSESAFSSVGRRCFKLFSHHSDRMGLRISGPSILSGTMLFPIAFKSSSVIPPVSSTIATSGYLSVIVFGINTELPVVSTWAGQSPRFSFVNSLSGGL